MNADVELYRSAVQASALCAGLLAQHDIPKLLRDIGHSHSIGPILDPTLYRDRSRAMDEDAEILRAALPLRNLGVRLERAVPHEGAGGTAAAATAPHPTKGEPRGGRG